MVRVILQNHQVVLIGGAMRSGTTVIHRVLCTGENTNPYISESWFLADIMRLYGWNLTRYDVRHSDQFGHVKNFREVIWSCIRQYLSLVSVKYNDPELLILKHPELTYFFPELANNFSNFKFIVIVRDPRDVIASMLRVAKRHKEEKLITPQTEIVDIKDFCKSYSAYYENVFKNMNLLKNKLLFVKYENFVSNTKEQLALISEFSGAKYNYQKAVDFQPEHALALNFNKEERLKDKFSGAFWSEQYTQSLTSDKIGTYKSELNANQVKEIETHLDEIGRKFGYWGK